MHEKKRFNFVLFLFPPFFFVLLHLYHTLYIIRVGCFARRLVAKALILFLATREGEGAREKWLLEKSADIRTGIFIVLRWACKSFLFPYELRRRDSVYIWGVVISKCWESRLAKYIYIHTYISHIFCIRKAFRTFRRTDIAFMILRFYTLS